MMTWDWTSSEALKRNGRRLESARRPYLTLSIFIYIESGRCCLYLAGVEPATVAGVKLLRRFGAPSAGLVGVDRKIAGEDWIEQLPGLFDVVLAGKTALIAGHGVFEEFLVRQHIVRSGRRRRDKLDRVADESLAEGLLK